MVMSCAGTERDQNCTVEEDGLGGAKIVCPDGTSAMVAPNTVIPDTYCKLTDNGDGTSRLECPDGTNVTVNNTPPETTPPAEEPIEPPVQPPIGQEENTPPVTVEDLSEDELKRVDYLRTCIDAGLEIGQNSFLDEVDIVLADNGIVGYESDDLTDDYSVSEEQPDDCPFVQYYDNGFATQTEDGCDFMLELAKIEMYSQLGDVLATTPAPADSNDTQPNDRAGDDTGDEEAEAGAADEEAEFWYEQGAISGIEQYKVVVRSDMKLQSVCDTTPTVPQSAYDKGLIIGAQILAAEFNTWLAAQGETPDYPTMSNPIQLCNIDDSALDPARVAAVAKVQVAAQQQPLCEDYAPPTPEYAAKYDQAKIEYLAGISDGIDAEFALAAVRIFQLIPCNVGDPIVVDLDGDGIELLSIYRGVNFDFYGTRHPQATAWVAADDGLIVYDRNENGKIDNGTELFGNVDRRFSDGFEHLSALDTNRDGRLDAQDSYFSLLSVWQDKNSDGKTDAGELMSLSEVGLTTIPLMADQVSMRSAGIRIPLVTESDGFLIGDALFQTAPYASPSLER
jgi:hypothetical protein